MYSVKWNIMQNYWGFVSEELEHADTMTYLIRRNIFNKKDLCVKNCN